MKNILSILYLIAISHYGFCQVSIDSFDIVPGGLYSNPSNLHDHNNNLLFNAIDSNFKSSLQITDGTYFPLIIKDNISGQPVSLSGYEPPIMRSLDSQTYLSAYRSNSPYQMWRIDKYNLLYPIVPLNDNGDTIYWQDLHSFSIILHNKLAFIAKNYGSFKERLFIYNTQTNRAYHKGGFTVQSPVVELHGTLYFKGYIGGPSTFGSELTAYDTYQDRHYIFDLKNGPVSSDPCGLKVINDTLFFIADNHYYYLDNKTMGAPQPKAPIPSFAYNTFEIKAKSQGNADDILLWHNNLYFSASLNKGKYFLYRHDLNSNTTYLLDTNFYDVEDLTIYNNKIFYSATSISTGNELVVFDGIKSSIASDIYKGSSSSSPEYLKVANNKLFFNAIGETTNWELFVYEDATATVKSTSFNATVTVYPNPAQDVAHINIDLQATQKLSITLIDIQGRTVYNTGLSEYYSGTNIVDIPTNNIPAGMYIYNIINDNGNTMMSGKLQKH